MLAWVLGNRKKKKGGKRRKRPTYEKAKEIAASGDVEARRDLATHDDLEPELLYFFATDDSPEVRREVAGNDGSPLQADVILARDEDLDVRSELARKIGRLIPTLTDEENERLTEMAMEVLEILAHDEFTQVRAIIAEEIKLLTHVPKEIVVDLARDIEEIVAAPILEYSPLLSEHELMQIIAGGVQGGALAAVSRRNGVSGLIAEAVVATRDEPAVKALLENQTSVISDKTLDSVGVAAPDMPDWHRPLVERANLSLKTIRRIATFVSAALVERLIARNDLAAGIEEDLRQSVRERIERGELESTEPDLEPADERAKKLHEMGKLDEEAIEAAIEKNDVAFVRHALQFMSGLPPDTVSKMLKSNSGKAVVALAWKAGLNMSMAESIQRRVARVQPKSMLTDPGTGDFPMSEEDMDWYLSYFSE